MIILPAIDIKDGACVRLCQGDFSTAHRVAEDPMETARRFYAEGARWLHLVDLDGARTGLRPNRRLILQVVAATKLRVELGGGIRDLTSVEDYLENGVGRVILGSAALRDPDFVREAVRRYGGKIAVGIDAKGGKVSTQGWLDTSDVDYITFAREMEKIGVRTVVFTDIARDGMLQGPNFDQLAALRQSVSCRVVASGGIRDLGHIRRLAELGLDGAICGKSVYSGTLGLADAVAAGGVQDAC